MPERMPASRVGPVSLWAVLAAAGSLALIFALVIGAHTWKSSLHVREIVVEGNSILPGELLRRNSGITIGAPLYTVDLNTVRAKLLAHPSVKEATVERDAPGRIVLSVVERVPVAAAAGARLHYLDADGFVMPAVATGNIIDVPVLSGSLLTEELKPGEQVKSPHLLNALDLARKLQVMEGVNPRISEVYVKNNGDVVLFTAEGGVPVLVGTEDYAGKLLSFKSFWEQVVLREDLGRLQLVDVRYRGQVIARWDAAGRKQI